MPAKRVVQEARVDAQKSNKLHDNAAPLAQSARVAAASSAHGKAVKSLQAVIKAFRKTQSLDLRPLKPVVADIVREVAYGGKLLRHHIKNRINKNCIYHHSVNVCITAVWIAGCMQYDEEKLRELALGALLHDLGMMLATDDVITHSGTLSLDEIKRLWNHPQQGFDLLLNNEAISAAAAKIILQHHQRFDGRGYPGDVKGRDIHEYARITTIADLFEYMISDSRHRRGLLPNEAGEILMIFSDTIVDGEILELFLRHCKFD